MKIGIDNLKMVLVAVAKSAGIVDGVTNHGTTLMEKIAALMQLVPVLATLPVVSLKAIGDEVSDLDEVEKAQLLAAFKQEFAIADHKLEVVLEGSLGLLGDLDGMVKKVEVLVKEMKAA